MKIKGLAAVSALLLMAFAGTAGAQISRKNLRYVEYPEFPEAHSTWGSIGYSSKFNRVYVGVTNHRDKVGLFEYDIDSAKMRLCGFLPQLAHLRSWQWQGKVHSQITEGPDGCVYFTTDGGESREEFLMNHPQGYSGGFFMQWDPAEGRLTNLGRGLQYESIKDMQVSSASGVILGVSYPQVHLLLYDWKKNDLKDLGRVGSDHVPRVLFEDWFGNMYYVDWRQRLIKYEARSGRLLFCRDSLPAFEGTPGPKIITGVTAYAKDQPNGVIYLVTYGSMLVAYYPTQSGFGRMEALGGVYDDPAQPPHSYYCPNLGLGTNGKLYYFIGGHGMYAGGQEQNLLMEFDPASRTRRAVLSFPLKEVDEVTGAGVRDSAGNLYFCGRRSDSQAEQRGESGASRPFMIIFNPEKEINPQGR